METVYGKNIRDILISRAFNEVITPDEGVLGFFLRGIVRGTKNVNIITDQRVILWWPNKSFGDPVSYFTYDQIVSVYSDKAFGIGIGDLHIITNGGRRYRQTMHKMENDIASNLINNALQFSRNQQQVQHYKPTINQPQQKFCTQCGSANTTTAKFCIKCGNSFAR